MSSAVRNDLAAALKAAMPEGWTVYSEPPDQLTSPAVTIGPGSPYMEPSAICVWATNLQLIVTVPRSATNSGLDPLDDALGWILPAVNGVGGYSVESVDSIGLGASTGVVEHLTAIVSVRVERN